MGYPVSMSNRRKAPMKPRIAITPDVDAELKALKRHWNLQSHNKVLRRLLHVQRSLNKEPQDV